jgi:hypothetical protein
MVLVEDPERLVIESLGARRHEFEKLYEVELMQQGGMLEGYRIGGEADVFALLSQLAQMLEGAKQRQRSTEPLFWAMGDGNHSLATAKANWDEVKSDLMKSGRSHEVSNHPARYAMVEIVNVYSSGLRFEPIHRVVFTEHTTKFAAMIRSDVKLRELEPVSEAELKALLASPEGQTKAGYFDGSAFFVMHWTDQNELPPALVDGIFQRFLQIDSSAKIDFVHGWEDSRKHAGPMGVACFLPVLERDRLFSHVGEHGPLPRKAFSMGDAEEKRYYMEARKITR